jgi:hypothetical protein
VRHRQLDRRRQLDADRLVLVKHHLGFFVLLEVVDQVADPLAVEVDLVVGLLVHEDVVVALLVEVLHLALVEVGLLDLVVGPEALGDDGAGLEVLELEVEDGAPVPGRVEVAVDDLPELAVLADDDHALAHLAVFDGGHRSVSPAGTKYRDFLASR